jgi:hypothetical protein
LDNLMKNILDNLKYKKWFILVAIKIAYLQSFFFEFKSINSTYFLTITTWRLWSYGRGN